MSKKTVLSSRQKIVFLLALILNCSACAGIVPFIGRDKIADDIASGAGFAKSYVQTSHFTLTSYYRFSSSRKPLHVYIEGDGRAWKSRRKLSDDPTPTRPIGLRLAALDESDNVAYIARPGQYAKTDSTLPDPAYWSQKRFALEVVNSISQAIDRLKVEAGASEVELIGYSGGGGLAILVASERKDVLSIRTVAGNLDHRTLCEYHKVSPLTGSLNPIDVAKNIANIPQYHFVSAKDKVVGPFIAEKFLKASGNPDSICIIYVKNATHTDGWVRRWPVLLSSYR